MHRRTGSAAFAVPTVPRPNSSQKFHLHDANDDESNSDSDTVTNEHNHSRLKVPFPSSSSSSHRPTASTTRFASHSTLSAHNGGADEKHIPRPVYARTASSPVILSNGKPLKPSLKSSSSSPFARRLDLTLDLPKGPALLASLHTRAASAPVTPNEVTEDPLTLVAYPSPSSESLPGTPKNVHFASELSSVRIFNRGAKPAALLQLGDETETDDTELEGDSGMPGWDGGRGRVSLNASKRRPKATTAVRDAFPFPSFTPQASQPLLFNQPSSSASTSSSPRFILSPPPLTSPIPNTLPSPYSNLHLESTSLIHTLPTDGAPSPIATDGGRFTLYLQGTILVRNLSYAKTVAVRFTMDEWQTTSEVAARFQQSCVPLPKALARMSSNSNPPNARTAVGTRAAAATANTWDRFQFTIRLEDYEHKLDERTLWLVVRYSINDGKDEWWDNNSGRNYRLAFTLSSKAHSLVATSGIDLLSGPAAERYRERGLSAPGSCFLLSQCLL